LLLLPHWFKEAIILTRRRRRSSKKRRPRDEEPRTRTSQLESPKAKTSPLFKKKIWIAAVLAGAIIVSAGLIYQFVARGSNDAASGGSNSAVGLSFVGNEVCAGCHQSEAELWRQSQHKHAMDHATKESVLGDFDDAILDYYGVHSRFFTKNGRFFVETDGPDGNLATFEAKYTFGVDPLQQYLVEFPDGRLQALSLAWDSRPKDNGGQRWFHLYPNEPIRHDDVLHWTKLNQNWNFTCAECHSTGVRKNYDATSDRFSTTWAEISVGCEACHGAGSGHVKWAQDQKNWWVKGEDPTKGLAVRFDERTNVTWAHDANGNPHRSSSPAVLRKEVETCGLCHARRSEFSEDWRPGQWLSDTHAVALLSRGLYSADGQMSDEVYNYGSFKQSKMFAAGVTCSNCHDPHSAKLRFSGDNVCLQCHAADKYATATHSHHEGVNPPVACASCHMPVRTYMVIDKRHDHSFRVPRPDLSIKLGTPNACNDCHTDKSAEWAASAIEQWFGPKREGFQNYSEAFRAAWTDQSDAAKLLAAVAGDHDVPAFVRASALSELSSRLSPSNIKLAQAGLADPDPVVRIGALDMLQDVPATQLWTVVSPLLDDPSRGVRLRAIALLADIPSQGLTTADREKFERVGEEFVVAQRLNADRPEARSALGQFYAQRGHPSEAEAEYKAALKLSPQYAAAAVNLSDLYRELGRDNEGEGILRSAITASPQDAGLHHALGLVLVRLNRRDEALEEFRKAVELAPGQSRYAYVYAIGLHSSGRQSDAITILRDNLSRHPADRDTLLALINFNRETGDLSAALKYAEQLAAVEPTNTDLENLVQELRGQSRKP
jgi:predicted CXXCH cytochrome family protein